MTALRRPRTEQFAVLVEASEAASRSLGAKRATVLLAGLPVEITFVGGHLYESMIRAFGHVLTQECRAPELRLTVWDEATSGVPLPPELEPRWSHTATSLGVVPVEDGVVAYFDADAAALSCLDVANNRGLLWLEDAGRMAERHRAAPFQTILTWWLPRHGRSVVHAAAVGTSAGAVVLCGSSGAGKSTTALSCLRDGFEYLSDDLCAVTIDGAVAVSSLYCTGKLHEHHLAAFPDFERIVINRERHQPEKAIAYLTDLVSSSLSRSLPLRAAIVLTAKVDGPPQLRPIAPTTALRAIAPATLHDFPGFGREGFARQAAFLSRLPCFEMDLSRDLSANPASLRLLLEELGARGGLSSEQ